MWAQTPICDKIVMKLDVGVIYKKIQGNCSLTIVLIYNAVQDFVPHYSYFLTDERGWM
jgi:hypothetical protein